MIRYRFGIAAHRGIVTSTVLLGVAALAPIGCTGDTATIVLADPGAPDEAPAVANVGAAEGDGEQALNEPAATSGNSEDTAAAALTAAPDTTPDDAAEVAAAGGATSGTNEAIGGDALPVEGIDTAEGCWQLPVINRARLLAPLGNPAALVGGKIVGSNVSATNGFVDLALVAAAPSEGSWLELEFENAEPYRYVKYYGAPGAYGSVAELELYAGPLRLTGAAFGSAGSRDGAGSVFARALDGDESTAFEGPLPSDVYVGLDLGAGHLAAAPTFSPSALAGGTSVSVSAEPGANVFYTTDGADPRKVGLPYVEPIALPVEATLLKAVARRECALESEVTQAVFGTPPSVRPGAAPGAVQSSMHIGNSLTDTIVETLETVAADGGIALDFNRYTIPGAGTWLYDTNPSGGFGVADVQVALRTRPFDHVSMQPFPNFPCQPLPSSDGNDSDSGYLDQAWADARTQNPNVQFWVYQQWPEPVDYINCITGGRWTRGNWNPPAPVSWEDAVATELTYQEIVRNELVRLNPGAPEPYIVPGGLALVNLKHAIESGSVPGIDDFFGRLFSAGGTDIHLTRAGQYFITIVFYACMFQQSPEGLINDTYGELTGEQAAIFQRLAWETVTSYPLSGVLR